MSFFYFVALIIGSIAIVLVVIKLWLNRLETQTKISPELIEWLKDLGRRVEDSTTRVDQRLAKNMEIFNTRLDHASSVIAQVQRSIGEFSEIGRSMKDLQEFLQSPKMRGNIGEQVLKELLAQSLPPDSFVIQYTFKNGDKVDALIKTSNGFIPIDSKFPLESFKKLLNASSDKEKEGFRRDFERDVKKHILDISRKYILVSEGTVDYALMYIPSEAVYYEMLNNSNLYDFAGQRRVLPVSPMSFYAYLKAILMSYEGARIQSQAKEILSILKAIQKDYEKGDEAMSVLTRHVVNAYNQLNQVSKVYTSLGQKIRSTGMLASSDKQEKLIE